MQSLLILIVIITSTYGAFSALKFLTLSLESQNRLKYPTNPIRKITEQEKAFLSPHLSIHSLSLVSDQIYQLDNAKITFAKLFLPRMNKTSVKMQADRINIFFPYPLDNFLIEENTIEYVITKVGREMYATAISVNGHNFLQPNIELWGFKPEAKVLSTRNESKIEYRVRQSKISYGWGLFYFCLALLFCLMSLMSEQMLFLNIWQSAAVISIVLMIYSVLKTKSKNAVVKEVKRIKGTPRFLPTKHLEDVRITLATYFVGLNFPTTEGYKNQLNDKNKSQQESTEAEVVFDEKSKHYTLLSVANGLSVEEHYKKHPPRPNDRLGAFSFFAMLWFALFYFTTPPLLENITAVEHYLFKNNHQILTKEDELLNAKRGDYIDFIDLANNIDVEIDSSNQLDFDAIRIFPKEQLQLPQDSDELIALAEGDFFEIENSYSRLKDIYFSRKYSGLKNNLSQPPEQEIISSYSMGSAPVVKIIEPNNLLNLLDKVCSEKLTNSCEQLYQNLAQQFSTPQNFYLIHLYQDYKNKPLPVAEFKQYFGYERLLTLQQTVNGLRNTVMHWANQHRQKNKQIKDIANLTQDRGGIILKRESILNEIVPYSSFDTIMEKIQKVQKRQNTKKSIAGVISKVSTTKGILTLDLIRPTKVYNKHSITIVVAKCLIFIVMLLVLLSYIFPARYPKSNIKK
ncbi:hypothetical protein QJU23_06710 [Pasteurella atlantica]|uniref:Uncharacterized protein n=2 Tax=Pasteurellaceae TaxID=712 RepID=A0ACC6HMK7_9PAST|nr:hypothetical protein [Pasteurella atlantica]MDP8052110.1 hypothetical protein [Pasteurella atlantica]MDP8105267.1 hypothetical protein [Pasteurella atlantica]MDP8149012.1 hypothetical protein [Pasteurella atlantica]